MKSSHPGNHWPSGSSRLRASFIPIALSAVLWGCSPQTEREKEYFERREQEQETQEDVSKALKGSTRQAEAMTMVKEQDAPDGRGTTEEWIDRKVTKAGVNVMFPRWKVLPRGSDKFEVRYEYSMMGEGYSMEKFGYAWEADLVLKIVSPHRELSDAELRRGRSGSGSQISQQQRRERERVEDFSLE